MKERKTLLITVATVCIYTAILVGWHLYVPRENLTIQVPGADNRPEGLARKANDVVIGEYFMKYEEKINTVRVIVSSFVLLAIPLFLIYKQPNLSTMIVITLVFCALLFMAGLNYKLVVGVLIVCIPVGLIGMTLIIQDKIPFIHAYQLGRIMAWLYPDDYPDLAYQQQNSIMAIGSGLLWGKGLNNTDPTSVKNGNFILEPQNDFIFAVAGEELGFIGSVFIILLLFLIVVECIITSRKAKDLSGKIICCGVAGVVGFQSFLNICVATGVLPNTGTPLPFVSYGLTSLVSLYIGMGLVLNVGLQNRRYLGGEKNEHWLHRTRI